jgi:mannose-6-phosphate isomerase-like protein (cupin superfamily)
MPIEDIPNHLTSEAEAVAHISSQGFVPEVREYSAAATGPHSHEYDVLLHVLNGTFSVGLEEGGVAYSAGPGDSMFVPAGVVHFEDHGPVRVVVGRRHVGG